MKLSFRIVVASYRTNDVAIELFGRTADGKSVTALFFGFKPYFYVIGPSPDLQRNLKAQGELEGTENTQLWYEGKNYDALKVIVKSPWKVPEMRKDAGQVTLAADIPFHHRFIYDNDLGSCVEVDGEEIP